jgi:hypothetical protein
LYPIAVDLENPLVVEFAPIAVEFTTGFKDVLFVVIYDWYPIAVLLLAFVF